jgi:hypothetical protein
MTDDDKHIKVEHVGTNRYVATYHCPEKGCKLPKLTVPGVSKGNALDKMRKMVTNHKARVHGK